MAMFFVIAIVFQHFGYLLGKWYSFEGWMCIDPFTVRNQSNTGCAFAALFGTFGSTAGYVTYYYEFLDEGSHSLVVS